MEFLKRDIDTCAKIAHVYEERPQPIQTMVLDHMLARIQRTHDRRKACVFVGEPGIGKSTAIEAFRASNPGCVIVIRLQSKVTGTQVLQMLLAALRQHNGKPVGYITNATAQVVQQLGWEIQSYGDDLPRDARPDLFPYLTVIFDEAQYLTKGAIDALRAYNEPHYFCAGTFPLGLVFVGNDQMSLENRRGDSVLDAAMRDRLLYTERLDYNFVTPDDIAAFVQAHGITDKGAQKAIVTRFSGNRIVRSFRQILRFVDDCKDEAGDDPVTAATVLSIATL